MSLSISTILVCVFLFAFFLLIPVMIGIYVYRDAKRRHMDAALWTILAILVPSFIGFVIYLIVRSSHSDLSCPQCGAAVTREFMVCPNCGAALKNQCPNCGHAVESGWKVCPRCSAPLPENAPPVMPVKSRDKNLKYILVAVIAIPLVLFALLAIFSVVSYQSIGHSDAVVTSTTDGFTREEITNPEINHWLDQCDQSGDGIYVLQYTSPENETSLLVYRKGVRVYSPVSCQTETSAVQQTLMVTYEDTQQEKDVGNDYSLFLVSGNFRENFNISITVDGQSQPYQLDPAQEPLTLLAGTASLYLAP